MKPNQSPDESGSNQDNKVIKRQIKYFQSRQINQLNQNFIVKLNRRESNCGQSFIDIELGKPNPKLICKQERIQILREKIQLNKEFIDKHSVTNTRQLDKIISNLDWISRDFVEPESLPTEEVGHSKPNYFNKVLKNIIGRIFKNKDNNLD